MTSALSGLVDTALQASSSLPRGAEASEVLPRPAACLAACEDESPVLL